VISNLAGNQITNFLKQYTEFGLTFPVAGFGFDTGVAWAAGKGNFLGTWPLVWHHLLDDARVEEVRGRFPQRYNRPPENQAWGDYNAMKLTAQAMAETKSIDATKIVEHIEKEAKFPLMKTRDGYFRKSDHQMMHEMYTVVRSRGADQERVGHLHAVRGRARPERVAGGDRDAGRRDRMQDGVTMCC
jgi:branched-chain amino acid transport system substrate-binding protein